MLAFASPNEIYKVKSTAMYDVVGAVCYCCVSFFLARVEMKILLANDKFIATEGRRRERKMTKN